MKKFAFKIAVLLAMLVVAVLLGCPSLETVTPPTPNPTNPSPDSVAAARQAMVDAMSALPSGYDTPEFGYDVPESDRLEGWFDVNQYFSVLNHLSLQPGYTLDYVYSNFGSGAHPDLYATNSDRPEDR
ncbi:MAG: hypothetical protein FJ004_12260, partial [Chloroflexi bacterium]|nr:hypothetical protein [Chloroflexota bacterium]